MPPSFNKQRFLMLSYPSYSTLSTFGYLDIPWCSKIEYLGNPILRNMVVIKRWRHECL